jgi:hypothetical protein
VSGPKCSELSPTEIEALRQRVRQRAQLSLADFIACELEFRAIRERLVELGEKPAELMSGSQLRAKIFDLINRGLENEAANLAERELAAANNALVQAGKQLERCVAVLQKRHRQAAIEAEALSREMDSLSRFQAVGELPTEHRIKITKLLKELNKAGVPPVPILELNSAGLDQLNVAETSLKEAREQIASSRHEIESLLNEFHDTQLLQTAKSHLAATQKLEELLKTRPVELPAENDPTLTKLEKLLSNMASLECNANWTDLMRQVESIRREPDLAHRRTLYEALAISFNAQLRHLREINAWRKELWKLLGRTMLSSRSIVRAIAEELTKLDRAGRVVDLSGMRERLEKALTQEAAEEQSQRRRSAVLDSLAELGYEVEEGLETGFVQRGKLVMRKADEDEYAVELVVNNDCSLVQTAVIRYAANLERSPYQHLRDREREETWCRDYAQWQQRLKDQGWNTAFKLKIPAGQQPVKVVVDKTKIKATRSSSRKQTSRQRAAKA